MRRQRQTKDEWKNTVAAQQACGLKISEYLRSSTFIFKPFRRLEVK
ncbi:hypothetical protein [uncultured Paraglaciecola sp.]|tara:strand:- start:48 stop:185 length:138 start_codon:yes stop_codon:yes gene_type:complete